MNNLQVFNNNEFGEIRTVEENGQIWFCLVDICKALGLEQVSRVKSRLLKDGVTSSKVIDSLGREQTVNVINESNLYKTIFQSKKPSAERFTNWVTSEVLPSIRKHGTYATDELLNNPDLFISVLQDLKKEREEKAKLEGENKIQKQIIGELQPKANYTDVILNNKGLVTITQIAKDYGKSGTAMNDLLHNLGVQYKQGGQWLLYAKYHDKGYTHSNTVDITRSDGSKDVKMNTKWTQKGRLFIYNLLKDNEIYPLIEK